MSTTAFSPDGAEKKELPHVPRRAELSPDGARLLEARFVNGADDIFVSNADGTHSRRIARAVAVGVEAHWSPDGTRIVYASPRGGSFQIYEVDARGNVLRKFSPGGGDATAPQYTPDGRISYLSRRKDVIQKLPPRSLIVTDGVMTRTVVEERPITSYAWSPTGQQLAFSTPEGEGLITTRDLASGAERTVRLREVDERLSGLVARDVRWRPDGGAIACRLAFLGGRWEGSQEPMFGERQLFVLYPDGRATWFDIEMPATFDWVATDALPK